MMHLKSKAGKGLDRKFAVLLEPKINPSAVSSDEQMYSEVAKNGKAVVAQFEDDLIHLKPQEEMTPQTFEAAWMGD